MHETIKNQAMTQPMTEDSPAIIDMDVMDKRDPLANFLRFRLNLDPLKLWFIAILYLGIFEKLILPILVDVICQQTRIGFICPTDGSIFRLEGSIRDWNPHIEALLTGFIEFPIFLAYYLWSGRGAAGLFHSFIENDSFSDSSSYSRFLKKAFDSFGRRLWPVLSLLLALLVGVVINVVIWKPDAEVPPWFSDSLLFRVNATINIVLVAYAVAQVMIRETLIIVWLRRLWAQCGDQLVVHPYHADGAGGLGAIGHHALYFFYFVVTVFIFIAMATILPGFLATAGTDEQFRVSFWNNLLPVLVAIYFILIPTMFLLLVWPAHIAMLRERDERLSDYSKHLDRQLEAARKHLTPARSSPETKTEQPEPATVSAADEADTLPEILKEVNEVKNLRSVILQDYTTWPISADTKRMFGVTSSLPTLYSFVAFILDIFG